MHSCLSKEHKYYVYTNEQIYRRCRLLTVFTILLLAQLFK
uniref:Uncharacterized protein n=1 Tax=Podoviridae sp. ctiVc2 TaxID=2827745 RepID=A0A8S5S9Z5_9CAUD|nr:MAG TPA: hypothetical protein [Podoviridae sp. ctiVc2]